MSDIFRDRWGYPAPFLVISFRHQPAVLGTRPEVERSLPSSPSSSVFCLLSPMCMPWNAQAMGIATAAFLAKLLRAGAANTPQVFQGSETHCCQRATARLQNTTCGLNGEVPRKEALNVKLFIVFYSANCL